MRKLALLILAVSCKSVPEAKQPPVTALPAPVPSAVPQRGAPPQPGIDLSILDRAVSPCDDFYRFACGKWLDRTPIPEDRPLWGRAFSEILERNELVLKEIVEKDARGEADPADPYAQKVGDFYAACMDEGKAETASLATLREELKAIDAVIDIEGAGRTRKTRAR
jgi:putative endopeptidase